MRLTSALLLSVLAATPVIAAGRLPLSVSPSGAADLLVPEAAEIRGPNGEMVKTDLIIRNGRNAAQYVSIGFLDENYGKGDVNIGGGTYLQLQPFETHVYEDVVDQLINDEITRRRIPPEGVRGHIVIEGIQSIPSGYDDPDLDPEARLTAMYRTWTERPEGGTVSYSADALAWDAGSETALVQGTISGVRADKSFSTDLAIWNDGSPQSNFRLTINGPQGPRTLTLIPGTGLSHLLVPVPSNGLWSLTIELTNGGGSGRWSAYATTTDNRTGDSWVQMLVPEK